MITIDTRRALKPFGKLRSSLVEMPPDPTPGHVQKFRLRLRRIEAVLDACDLSSGRDGCRILQCERPLRVRAGKIHDMDTAIVLAQSLQARGAEQCRTELLELIGAKRYHHARKLCATAEKSGRKLAKCLERCESTIRLRLGPRASARDKTVMAAKLAALILQVGSELAHYPRLSHDNLHLFRIRIRYFRRLLRLANQQRTQLYGALTQAHNAIGDWHDWHRLWKIARELQGHPGHRALLAEIRREKTVRLQRAMHVSRELRAQHLSALLPERKKIARPRRQERLAA